MKLSAEQFAELASTFQSQPASHEHERRRASRMELAARVKVIPVAAGARGTAKPMTICDFSARGIALIDSQPMDLGQQFILELPRREGAPAAFLCTVMHIMPVGEEMHRIGAEFTCALEPSAAQAGGASKTSKDSAETRRIRASMLQ